MIYIYSLEKNNIPFCIGKTNNPKRREKEHKIKYGNDICLVELDQVFISEWKFWECHYISLFKSWGFELQNKNNGGGGPTFQKEESKKLIGKKVSLANKGKSKPKEFGNLIKKLKTGIIKSEESKNKQSKSRLGIKHNKVRKDKGKNISNNHKEKISLKTSKKVYQYDLQGNFIKEWESRKKAGESNNINIESIGNNLLGYSKSAGGFIWKYNRG